MNLQLKKTAFIMKLTANCSRKLPLLTAMKPV